MVCNGNLECVLILISEKCSGVKIWFASVGLDDVLLKGGHQVRLAVHVDLVFLKKKSGACEPQSNLLFLYNLKRLMFICGVCGVIRSYKW